MANIDPIAKGTVVSLATNGVPAERVCFNPEGPGNDRHSSFSRQLSGHDGDYIKTSQLVKGDVVFNTRSWTGLCTSEIAEVEKLLWNKIPVGCLLENVRFSGIPNFSELPPTSRIVFPKHDTGQAILIVFEKNGPCATVGKRLAEHYHKPDLTSLFVRAAQNRRGVMGFVYSRGLAEVGDEVLVYPPVK
jgi:hypothetical protein